jgi:hypothetical protein
MNVIRTALLGMAMVLVFMTGSAFAQFEDLFLKQTETIPQEGAFAKSGWGGSINTGSSGVAYSGDFNAVKAAIKTPQQASAYMAENFTYGWDTRYGGFKSTPPAEVNSTKWGSCKEFTSFFDAVLADDGIQVQPVMVRYGSGDSSYHIMSVATYNGGAYLQSNQDIWSVGSNQQIIDLASGNLPGGVIPFKGGGEMIRYYPQGTTNFTP